MKDRNAWFLMLALAAPLAALEPQMCEVRGVTVVDLPAKASAAVRQYDTGRAIRVFPTEPAAVDYIKGVWAAKEGKK